MHILVAFMNRISQVPTDIIAYYVRWGLNKFALQSGRGFRTFLKPRIFRYLLTFSTVWQAENIMKLLFPWQLRSFRWCLGRLYRMLCTASGGCVLYLNHQISWNHSKYFFLCLFLSLRFHQGMTEAEHNWPIPKFFGNWPLAWAAKDFWSGHIFKKYS